LNVQGYFVSYSLKGYIQGKIKKSRVQEKVTTTLDNTFATFNMSTKKGIAKTAIPFFEG